MISIDGLHALAEALARLDFSAAQRDALEQAAQQLETSVRQTLSHRPGEDHTAHPGCGTPALYAKVSATMPVRLLR